MSPSTIASLTPTVARLFGALPPALTEEPPLADVVDRQEDVLHGGPVDRCLVFCPDALGAQIWKRSGDQVEAIVEHADIRVPLSSVVPPKTPVCFASMFTGAQPGGHGIRKYERPVLTCDTLFDALARAGRKVAIIAVEGSSIDLIFRGREIDHWSERCDGEVADRAVRILREDRHDLVVAYQQEYDDQLHATEPFSEPCLRAVENHLRAFATVAGAAARMWRHRDRAFVFAPDHGAHVDPRTGRGDHGLDIVEDMLLFHWYGLRAGS